MSTGSRGEQVQCLRQCANQIDDGKLKFEGDSDSSGMGVQRK